MKKPRILLAASLLGLALSMPAQSRVTRIVIDETTAFTGPSDLHGLVRTIMPSYVEFAELEEALSKRGMKTAEVEGILGGNYIRVLREAMKA